MATHFMGRGGGEEEKGRERRKREGRGGKVRGEKGWGTAVMGARSGTVFSVYAGICTLTSCEVWPSAEPAAEGEGIIIYTLAYQVRIYVSEDE